jgi:hypothetical protein
MSAVVNECDEIAWGVYQLCLHAHMQYLSEPLRRGEEHCVSPERVYLPRHIEIALDRAIRAFKPGEPSMREGNHLFDGTKVIFDAEEFKIEPRNVRN